MESSSRVLAAARLAEHLPSVVAHAAEHACHTLAAAQRLSYPRLVFRLLHLLQRGLLTAEQVDTLGPRVACGAPLEVLVPSIPAREEIARREDAHRVSRALLRDLTQGEIADIPDAGLKCKRCQSNDIAYDFLQTRSADEGTTIFCTCRKCGKRWKM
jgi:DNA-directed RNA polymerase subunit M/transcription elongation factor TFIIS